MKKRIYLSTLVFLFMSITAIMQSNIVSKANIPRQIRIGEERLNLSSDTEKEEFTGENWRYEKSSNTLYLDNCQLNDFIFATGGCLNIVVTGTNTITGISADELSISGDGILNVNFDDSNMTKLTKSHVGRKESSIIYVSEKNCTILDCSININVKSQKRRSVVRCRMGALAIEKSSISIITNGDKNKAYYEMISAGDKITIKESSLKLQGVFKGMYAPDAFVEDSDIYVRCNNKTSYSFGIYIYGETNVKNSTIDVKSPRTAMDLYFLKLNKSTIRLNSYGKKDFSKGSKFLRDGGLSLSGCDIKDSNIYIKGHFYGIIFEGESSQYIINNSQINVTAKKKSGIYVTKRNSLKIKNGGKISITGKKYAIEVEKKKIKFYGYSKLQFKVTKSLVNLKGKKVSNLGSFSKKKKAIIKNGNYVITHKK